MPLPLQNPVAKAKPFVYKTQPYNRILSKHGLTMDTMNVTLVTPEATFFSGSATMVEAPGALGDFGALPGHMPFITALKAGVVRVHDGAQLLRIFVAGGIAEVNNTSCTILAERVVDLVKLSRAQADERLAKARLAMSEAFDEPAVFESTRELELAEALILALE